MKASCLTDTLVVYVLALPLPSAGGMTSMLSGATRPDNSVLGGTMSLTVPLPFPDVTSPSWKKAGLVSEVLREGRVDTLQPTFAGTVTDNSCVPPVDGKVSGVERGLRCACRAVDVTTIMAAKWMRFMPTVSE